MLGCLQAIGEGVVYPFFTVDLDFASGSVQYGSETVESALYIFGLGLDQLTLRAQPMPGRVNCLRLIRLKRQTEVAARSASISLSGVPSSLLALALQTQYQGRKCIVQFGVYTNGGVLKEDGFYVLKKTMATFLLKHLTNPAV